MARSPWLYSGAAGDLDLRPCQRADRLATYALETEGKTKLVIHGNALCIARVAVESGW